jgi:hypothetical protein
MSAIPPQTKSAILGHQGRRKDDSQRHREHIKQNNSKKKKISLNLRTERDGHPGKGGLYKTKWK